MNDAPGNGKLYCLFSATILSSAGWTALMYASYVGHDTIVNLLLDAGVDPSCSSPTLLSPLMVAAGCGNESVCYFLIQVSTYTYFNTLVSLLCICMCVCVCACIFFLSTAHVLSISVQVPIIVCTGTWCSSQLLFLESI